MKALGHPLRIEILRLLTRAETGVLSVKQIQEALHISQPEASKQLIILKNQSVLLCERKDGHTYYSLNREIGFLDAIINHLKQNG